LLALSATARCPGFVNTLLKPAAKADRQRITQYITQDKPRAAVALGDLLLQKAEQLGAQLVRAPE
jgi:plasmid stabilization system protein ParE